MQCELVQQHFDELDDTHGILAAEFCARLEGHIVGCPQCSRAREQHRELIQGLRGLPRPQMRPGFARQAFVHARKAQTGRSMGLRMAAIAATVFVSVSLGVMMGYQMQQGAEPTISTVAMTLQQPKELNLVFHSPAQFADATFVIELPDGVEVDGLPNQRVVSWQAGLRKGQNLLSIPVVARQATEGEIVARIVHGSGSKTFRMNIELNQQKSKAITT